MAHGGARNRSGPAVDPQSERSEQRGLKYRLLPVDGYRGRIPSCPLPDVTARERKVWRQLWRYPQAAMWAAESWRLPTVAQYVRWFVRAEQPDAPASVLTGLLRLADQLGLSPAGLHENRWRIGSEAVVAEVPAEAAPEAPVEPVGGAVTPIRRLRG